MNDKSGTRKGFDIAWPFRWRYRSTVFKEKAIRIKSELLFYCKKGELIKKQNENRAIWCMHVEGQLHAPFESRYFSGFFILSVQVLVPSKGQEHSPITN